MNFWPSLECTICLITGTLSYILIFSWSNKKRKGKGY